MRHVPLVVLMAICACCASWGPCASDAREEIAVDPSPPGVVCHDPELDPDDVCVPGPELLARLAHEPFEVLDAVPVPGTTPAKKAVIRFRQPPRITVTIKWRTTPGNLDDAFNNSPRRELAALAVSQLLFGDDAALVPPTTLRCLDPEDDALLVGDATPTFAVHPCVLGLISVWLENVEESEELWSPRRFESDPRYRRAITELNLLAEIVSHGDSHSRNILVDDDDRPTRFFLVDNSFAFSGLFNPLVRWLGKDRNWAERVVPRIPPEVMTELATLDTAAFDRLATVAELELGPRGWALVRPVGPQGDVSPPFDPAEGVRRRGDHVQLGLTRSEIEGVVERWRDVIRARPDGDDTKQLLRGEAPR